jgi:hypothetical protein
MERELPNLLIPYTETVDPNRKYDLMETEDPMVAKSSTERELPSLAIP